MPQMVDHGYIFELSSNNMRVFSDGKLHRTVRQINKHFWTTTLETLAGHFNINLADRHFTPDIISDGYFFCQNSASVSTAVNVSTTAGVDGVFIK